MSIRPRSAVVRAVKDAVPPRSGRLASVLAAGLRSAPVISPLRTGAMYSEEPPAIDHDDQYGFEAYANRDPRWDTDIEWALEQLRDHPSKWVFASTEFRKTKRFALAMVTNSGHFLGRLSDLFKHDKDILTAALRTKTRPGILWFRLAAYHFVPEELKSDDYIIRLAFESAGKDGNLLYDALPDQAKLNREYIVLAVKANPMRGFRAIPDSAKRDRSFIIELIEQVPLVAKTPYIRGAYKDDRFWGDVLSRVGGLLIIPPFLPKTKSLLLAMVGANGDVLDELGSVQNKVISARPATIESGDHTLFTFFEFGEYADLQKDPEIRIAAATAKRNPNMKMIGALVADLDVSIRGSMAERSIVEDEAMERARMRRLQAYSDLLDKLVISVSRYGPMETKISELDQLIQLINDPKGSKDFVLYRLFRDLEGTMMEDDEQPSAKRARYATEASALTAGIAMDRIKIR